MLVTHPDSSRPAGTLDDLFIRNRYVLVADLVLIVVSVFLAFALRFDLGFLIERPEFLLFLTLAVCIKPATFFSFGLYRRFWRYASLDDMLVVAGAVTVASLALLICTALAWAVGLLAEASRAVLLIDWLLTLVMVGGLRGAVRIIGESKTRSRVSGLTRANVNGEKVSQKRILVVGAGEAGAMVVREMQRNPQLDMTAIGFLDDDPRKHGKRIYGVLVLGSTDDLERIVKVGSVDEILIAMPTASGAAVRAVAERCQTLGLRCRTMPGVFELLGDRVSISRFRQLEITDLLRRKQITPRLDASTYVTGRVVLVTGAGGSIGSELCRQVAYAKPALLIMLGHGENSLFEAHARLKDLFSDVAMKIVVADVRDHQRIRRIFAEYEPAIVFHAAAHKHVHLMEQNFVEAITNNIVGTQNLVDAALEYQVERFVTISTDKAVSPTCMMGASKRLASMLVREAGDKSGRAFVAVRFGNVLGSRGSVVPFFTGQIARGGPVTVTHPDMKRFFMTIAEAVHLVLEAGGIGSGGELFVLDMGEPVRILDLAEDLIRLSGYTLESIPIEFTGMRPGEKLEEALWEEGAEVERTAHADILRVVEQEDHSPVNLRLAVRLLHQAAENQDRAAAEEVLQQCIRTFQASGEFAPALRGSHQVAPQIQPYVG